MHARRTFLASLLALLAAPFAAKAKDKPFQRGGWVFMRLEEYKRLKSASTPIIARSDYIGDLYASWVTPGFKERMFETDSQGTTTMAMVRRSAVFAHVSRILEGAEALGIDLNKPGYRLEIRLVEDRFN